MQQVFFLPLFISQNLTDGNLHSRLRPSSNNFQMSFFSSSDIKTQKKRKQYHREAIVHLIPPFASAPMCGIWSGSHVNYNKHYSPPLRTCPSPSLSVCWRGHWREGKTTWVKSQKDDEGVAWNNSVRSAAVWSNMWRSCSIMCVRSHTAHVQVEKSSVINNW